ncbi:hypothetical protein P8452_70406 [Trifolium repens]|nr:hypothetical protein P8452_70406 [Trifolium repens]
MATVPSSTTVSSSHCRRHHSPYVTAASFLHYSPHTATHHLAVMTEPRHLITVFTVFKLKQRGILTDLK